MGHRNTREGRHRNRAAYSGNDLEGDISLSEVGRFLTTPAEDKRIAAFEADHIPPEAGMHCQEFVDFFLPKRVVVRLFSDKDALCMRRGFVEKRRIQQAVIEENLRGADALQAAHRDQFWITGPGADEIYLPSHFTNQPRGRNAAKTAPRRAEGPGVSLNPGVDTRLAVARQSRDTLA